MTYYMNRTHRDRAQHFIIRKPCLIRGFLVTMHKKRYEKCLLNNTSQQLCSLFWDDSGKNFPFFYFNQPSTLMANSSIHIKPLKAQIVAISNSHILRLQLNLLFICRLHHKLHYKYLLRSNKITKSAFG